MLTEGWKSAFISLLHLRRALEPTSAIYKSTFWLPSFGQGEGAAPSIASVETVPLCSAKKKGGEKKRKKKRNKIHSPKRQEWKWITNWVMSDECTLLGEKSSRLYLLLEDCFIYLCDGHIISHPKTFTALTPNQLPASQSIRLVNPLFLDTTSGFHRNCFKPHPLSIRTFYNFSTLMRSFVVPMVITKNLLSLKYCFLIRGFTNNNVLLEQQEAQEGSTTLWEHSVSLIHHAMRHKSILSFLMLSSRFWSLWLSLYSQSTPQCLHFIDCKIKAHRFALILPKMFP